MKAGRIPLGLVAAALLYLLLRGLILYTAFDRVALWMFELFPMGTIAELRLRGIEFPLHYYYDNAAGQILAGWLAVPAFWLFGSSYLALKLVPLALGFGTLLLVWFLLDRNFGRRAANLGALLFTVGPPTLVKYSVICSGNHFENLFFTMAALVCAFELHRDPENRGWLLASAFTAGFALFVFLGALIPVGILAGMHVGLRGIRRTIRDLAYVVPAFALGILPLVVLNASTGARGVGFLGAKFGGETAKRAEGVFERIGQFLGVHLPQSGVFEPFAGLSRPALASAYFAAFALAYAACLPGASRGIARLLRGVFRPDAGAFERARFVPLVLGLPLSALAFGISNFKIGVYSEAFKVADYRYFLPTILLGILAMSVAADRWWAKGGSARAAAVAVAALALVPGLSSFTIVDWTFSRPNLGRYYDGHDLSKLARALLSARNAIPRQEIVSRLDQYPPIVRGKVARAIGFNLGVFLMEKKGVDGALDSVVPELLELYPDRLRSDIACGAGIAVRFYSAMSGKDDSEVLAALSRAWERWPMAAVSQRESLIQGACLRNPTLPLADQTCPQLDANHRLILDSLASGSAGDAGAVARVLVAGQGRFCGRLLRRGIPSDVECVRIQAQRLRELPAALSSSFWEGLGWGLAEERDVAALPPSLRELPGVDMDFLLYGLGVAVAKIHPLESESASRSWLQAIDPEDRPVFERGLGAGEFQ
ncbi:MAG: ArnT family glycosyltransferase [Planctomycetota bacterium]